MDSATKAEQGQTPAKHPLFLFDLQARENINRAMKEGRSILDEVASLDLRTHELKPAEEAIPDMLGSGLGGPATGILKTVGTTIKLLTSLPGLAFGDAPEEQSEPDDDFDLDGMFGEAPESNDSAIEGTADVTQDQFAEELDDALTVMTGNGEDGSIDRDFLSGICEMMCMQLRGNRERFKEMIQQRSKWGIITEGEEARRKIRKSLRAGITLSCRVLGPAAPEDLFPNTDSELESARAVRKALMSFRAQALALCETKSILSADDARARVQGLIALVENIRQSNAYGEMRAPDRYQFFCFHQRLTSPEHGEREKDVVKDLEAFAGMLVAVNKREILVTHDKVIASRSLDTLEGLRELFDVPGANIIPHYRAILEDLRSLQGKDADLDATIEQGLLSVLGGAEGFDIRAHASELSERLRNLRY